MPDAKRTTKVVTAKKSKEEKVTEDMAVELLIQVRDNFPKKSKQQSKKK
jgi:hypothetical protein